jgi:amino acid adenylation domain-containing protein
MVSNGEGRRPLLAARPRPPRLQASYEQQSMWVIQQISPSRTDHNLSWAWRLRGVLNQGALRAAINAIVQRHEVLRTHFDMTDGEPEQVVDTACTIDVPIDDFSGLDETEQQRRATAALRSQQETPFDLATGPVLRARLLKLGPEEHLLLRTVHHIAYDGFSAVIFNRELMAAYAAACAGSEAAFEPLPVQYADFAVWQRSWLRDSVLDRGFEYWKGQLDGMPDRLSLPADRPRPLFAPYRARVLDTPLSSELIAALRRLARSAGCSLYMTTLAAFAVLVARHSGQDDVVIGSANANRPDVATERLIGLFANLLPIRIRVRSGCSFRQLMAQVRETSFQSYKFREIPFERLVEHVSPTGQPHAAPLCQVVFAMQDAQRFKPQLHGLTIDRPFGIHELQTRFDLTVQIFPGVHRAFVRWLYSEDMFDGWRMEQMAAQYLRLLEAVIADPDASVGALRILPDDERERLVQRFNEGVADVAFTAIPSLLEAQVEETPDAIAVAGGAEQVTYAALNARANQLAHYLRGLGVGPEQRVCISLQRSVDSVVTLVALLKTGAAYVPVDPEYPAARLAYMLADAKPLLVLTTSALRSRLPSDGHVVVLDAPQTVAAIAEMTTTNPVVPVDPRHPGYIIYTSGSTGEPKAVVSTQLALANRISWLQQAYALNSDDRLLHKTPYGFDVSAWEVFWPLVVGGRVVVAAPELHRDPQYIARTVVDERITHLHFVPSMLRVFLEEPESAHCASVRRVMCSGEALTRDLQRQLADRLPAAELRNQYGPTEGAEVTEWTCHAHDGSASPPIGRPSWNMNVYVLDQNGAPAPVGVAGELCIAGPGLARGYLNRPAATAARFVPDPLAVNPGTRMYRTGDLARWRNDGVLEFIGRLDNQVKIRGFRVELGEVETVLRSHEAVAQAVVMDRETSAGERELVAYVVPREQARWHSNNFRSDIGRWLPDYMVPATIVVLKALPLTVNGKVDTRALPAPAPVQTAAPRAPRTRLENDLCSICAEVLGIDQFGIDDDFFASGGHSLSAMRVISRSRTRLGLRLTFRTLLEHRTVAAILEKTALVEQPL